MTAPGSWIEHSACGRLPVQMFFPTSGDRRGIARAKLVCEACPVVAECLEYGKDERYGIWGGMTVRERHGVLRGSIDWVPAIGSTRRLRALAVLGYGPGHLEQELVNINVTMLPRRGISWIREGAIRTEPERAEAITRLYPRLVRRGLNSANRSIIPRRLAAQRLWPGPSEWAGVDMDDPLAQPRRLAA